MVAIDGAVLLFDLLVDVYELHDVGAQVIREHRIEVLERQAVERRVVGVDALKRDAYVLRVENERQQGKHQLEAAVESLFQNFTEQRRVVIRHAIDNGARGGDPGVVGDGSANRVEDAVSVDDHVG